MSRACFIMFFLSPCQGWYYHPLWMQLPANHFYMNCPRKPLRFILTWGEYKELNLGSSACQAYALLSCCTTLLCYGAIRLLFNNVWLSSLSNLFIKSYCTHCLDFFPLGRHKSFFKKSDAWWLSCFLSHGQTAKAVELSSPKRVIGNTSLMFRLFNWIFFHLTFIVSASQTQKASLLLISLKTN